MGLLKHDLEGKATEENKRSPTGQLTQPDLSLRQSVAMLPDSPANKLGTHGTQYKAGQ